MATTLHDLLLAYYGDDFTGSTDVMEALSKAGLRTVLFLAPPSPNQLNRFPALRVFGIAGGSRTLSPDQMEAALPPAFIALKNSGAPLIHYKICSTFDSSPNIGSIGRAIEIGRRIFGERPTPLVVGAPILGRYVVFGNLFARSGLDSEPFRLDRHPTMRRHPVTPMREADLRCVLAEQTHLPVELVDVLKLENPSAIPPRAENPSTAPIVLFDTLREEHLVEIGKQITAMAQSGPLFAVGSSGIEYALTAFWNRSNSTNGPAEPNDPIASPSAASSAPVCPIPNPRPVDQIVAVSGSCSPVTDRQIARALQHHFAEIALCPNTIPSSSETGAYLQKALEHIVAGRSVILHTSRGPDDPRLSSGGASDPGISARLGDLLASLLEQLLDRTGLRRAVVCGGDTSMHVARKLGSEALEYLGPMAPGSPLCKVHAPNRVIDGAEVVFKGGQVGRDRFFLDVLNGSPAEEESNSVNFGFNELRTHHRS